MIHNLVFQIPHNLAEQGHNLNLTNQNTSHRDYGHWRLFSQGYAAQGRKWMVCWELLSCVFHDKRVPDIFKAGTEVNHRTSACFRVRSMLIKEVPELKCCSYFSWGFSDVWLFSRQCKYLKAHGKMGHSSSWWHEDKNRHSVKVSEIEHQMKITTHKEYPTEELTNLTPLKHMQVPLNPASTILYAKWEERKT